MEEKALIIYHKVDLDGVASAAIAVDKMQKNAYPYKLHGWTYGDPVPYTEGPIEFSKVFVLDVSFGQDNLKIMNKWKDEGADVVWIDHHKSAITDDVEGTDNTIKGIRQIGKGACELTYEYLHKSSASSIIKLLSAYDVWDKNRYEWDDVLSTQYAIRAEVGLNVDKMVHLIEANIHNPKISDLIKKGKCIINFLKQKNESECNNFSFEAEILGHKAICMNTIEFNSTTFDSIWNPEKYDLMVPFAFQPNGLVRFSLYSTKEDVDCSEIAKRFNGGGHKGAAGFLLEMQSASCARFFIAKRII